MKRVFLALIVLGIVWWLYRRGVLNDVPWTAVGIGAVGLAVAGGLFGGLIGAGHTRERRAYSDYMERRAAVPVARKVWLAALAESARRMTLPIAVAIAVLLLLITKGRS